MFTKLYQTGSITIGIITHRLENIMEIIEGFINYFGIIAFIIACLILIIFLLFTFVDDTITLGVLIVLAILSVLTYYALDKQEKIAFYMFFFGGASFGGYLVALPFLGLYRLGIILESLERKFKRWINS